MIINLNRKSKNCPESSMFLFLCEQLESINTDSYIAEIFRDDLLLLHDVTNVNIFLAELLNNIPTVDLVITAITALKKVQPKLTTMYNQIQRNTPTKLFLNKLLNVYAIFLIELSYLIEIKSSELKERIYLKSSTPSLTRQVEPLNFKRKKRRNCCCVS